MPKVITIICAIILIGFSSTSRSVDFNSLPAADFNGQHVLNAVGQENGIVLNATVQPADATDKYVAFSTADKFKVNFSRIDDDSILVYAVTSFTGGVQITASIGGYSATCICSYNNGFPEG
ncbi:MAG TPA: hypothetical protein PKC96_05740 [Bacilli bacterium]|nr:hypothetical protein [Bacilli bacterium]HMM00826.1 hypothetical protein [Bacilli bacterium]